MDPRRTCARPLCEAAASASMSYDYHGRVVFVSPLGSDRHPAYYDLCAEHVRTLSPPRGWTAHTDTSSAPAASVGATVGAAPTATAKAGAPGATAAVGGRIASDAKAEFSPFPPRNRPDAYLRRAV